MKFYNIKDLENKVPKNKSFKHYLRIHENGGRIVKGVNTTADVGVDGIKKQAAKFGNKVDKDGRPPTLSKKVKGSKTNVLFNLGLAESKNPALHIGQALELEARAEAIWKRTVGRQFPWKSQNQRIRHIGKVIQAKQDPKKFIRDLNNSYNMFISFIQKNKFPTETIPLLRQIQKLLVDNTDESMLYYANMKEELGEIASTSQIFVDMDGVLADFFGSWTKLTGKDWRQIKGDDLEPALQKIKDKKDFWINLPKTSNADNLLSLIKQVKGSYNILSSPLPGDKNSIPQKKEWIKNNLQDFMPSSVIIDSNKAQYATNKDGTPNILIDDFGKNIASWEAAGGIGFKHKDHKFERTAKDIKQHMQEPVEEGRADELFAVQKAIDDIYNDPNWKDRRDELKKLIRRESELEKEMQLVKPGKMWRYDHDSLGRKKEVEEDIQLKEWVIPAFRFGLASIKFLGRFIRRNPKTSLGTFSLPWTGPILASFLKGLSWLYAYSIPVSLGVVALYGGKKLYNVLKDKDPDTISEEELEEILKGYAPKSDKDLKKLKSVKENYARAELPQITKKEVEERTLTKGEEKKKEKNVKGMKKNKGDFKDRYGKDADAVMYATATKMAKEALISGLYTTDQVLDLLENFADGKKSGKSKPGRVKKSGASCNGSVTELRKKAKNASGERAKMYHWCANMKSGRKKKGK